MQQLSLDPDRGQEIAQLIRKEVKSKNKSAIMVTHDRSILTYVDTIYELKHGQLLKVERLIKYKRGGTKSPSLSIVFDCRSRRSG